MSEPRANDAFHPDLPDGPPAAPGDDVFMPPYVPHREENPDPDEEAVVVIALGTQEAVVAIARSTQEAIVVNLLSLFTLKSDSDNRTTFARMPDHLR